MTINMIKCNNVLMKKTIIVFAVGMLTQQIIQAQGTIEVSNLGGPSAGSAAVGSDSWLATQFITGGIGNSSDYELDSIQLAMTTASGDPSDFTVMLFSATGTLAAPQYPAVSLGTLDGSANPSATGIYTFTPTANIVLLPTTSYFIVLTAGTTVANGAYDWSFVGNDPGVYTGSWDGIIDFEQSSDGSSWSTIGYGAQYAITATPVPEPGELALIAAGSLFFIWHRQKISSRIFKTPREQRPLSGVV
jgi:hypothetical protein